MRKTKFIKLTMLAGGIILGGCEPNIDEPPQFIKDEKACMENFDDAEGCKAAAAQAKKEFDTQAPKFDQQKSCEAQFGAAQCHKVESNGSSVFMPLMAGYFMGSIMNNGQRQYATQPACNNNGSIYSGGCGSVTGARGGYAPVNSVMAGQYNSQNGFVRSQSFNSSWTTSKVASSRVPMGSAAIVRGGFGSSATSVGE